MASLLSPLLIQSALALALPVAQGEAAGGASTTAVEPRNDTIGPLNLVLPPPNSAQPPFIEDQAELERLLRRDPAIALSSGSLSRSRDGLLTLSGGGYWLHQGFECGFCLELIAPDGVMIWTYPWLGTDPPGAAKELAGVARREIWHQALMQLGRVAGDLNLEGRFEMATEEDLATERGRAPASLEERIPRREYRVLTGTPPEAERGRNHGPVITLVVRNPGAEPAHLAVLSAGEDRYHRLVFPPPGAPDSTARLGPGAELRTPVRVGCDFLHDTPTCYRRPERGMLDRFFLIASREPFAYPSFREDRPPRIGQEGSPLERWVAREFCHTADLLKTPRVGPDALDPTQFGVTYVDLIVD